MSEDKNKKRNQQGSDPNSWWGSNHIQTSTKTDEEEKQGSGIKQFRFNNYPASGEVAHRDLDRYYQSKGYESYAAFLSSPEFSGNRKPTEPTRTV